MKIKHIFAAIELDSLDPARFPKHLVDAWRRIRFSAPPDGYSGSDRIGAALIGTDNFAWKSSGWFDRTGITFPADLLPRDETELLAHLEWMIDCRRNRDTLAYLWNSAQKLLPRQLVGTCFVERKKLSELAGALSHLSRSEPFLVRALLSGRLWRASALVAKKHERLRSREHLNTVVSMVIVWALFDLQVIAYRLFHAEWNPLDAGMDSPENMTLESLQKIAGTISDMGNRATKAFQKGQGVDQADPELRDFIAENDLLSVARKNAVRLKIGGLSSSNRVAERQAIASYLRYLQGRLAEIERIFARRAIRPRLTVTGYAAHAAGVSRGRFAPGPIRDPKARALESKQSVATARFSLPAMTALLYAVESVVGELGALPSGGRVRREADGQFKGGRPLFKTQQRKQLIARLFAIYRDLFVRSQFNGWNSVSVETCERLALEAESALASGRPNPGLEPPKAGWRSRPVKPLFPGVPATVLLSNGIPDADRVTGRKTPRRKADWKPNRVAAERKAETRNVRALSTDPKARRHFRLRADRIDEEFGAIFGHRLEPPEGEPPEA